LLQLVKSKPESENQTSIDVKQQSNLQPFYQVIKDTEKLDYTRSIAKETSKIYFEISHSN